jgi:hypothetical protein
MSRPTPLPHLQGALDGLCGVYATINAISLLIGSRKTADTLFPILCRYLDARGELGAILSEGSWFRQFCRIVDTASDWLSMNEGRRLERRVAARRADLELQDFWLRVEEHVDRHGPGSVLLGMSGQYNHWTCVYKVSGARMTLFDSSRLSHINRTNCTTHNARATRHHVLWPSQSLLLALK